MKVKTEEQLPDVKLVTGESVDDAVFATPSPDGVIHKSLDCRALEGKDLVFGYSEESLDSRSRSKRRPPDCEHCS